MCVRVCVYFNPPVDVRFKSVCTHIIHNKFTGVILHKQAYIIIH